MKNSFENAIDRIVSFSFDIIFSEKRKIERMLAGLMAVGFFLRLIAALNEGSLADDIVYASQSAGIISSGIISTHSNPPLFFYLTDLAYKIFGYTTFASRLWPLVAGTMLILLIFLITSRFFNKKVALLAAFFVTFSNFLIRMTFTEHSLLLFFFCFFAIYLGLLYLDTRKMSMLILSGIAFGLALLTKYNAPFFIFSFLIFAAYYLKNKGEPLITKRNIKHLIIIGAIAVFFALPFISFNYFIYKEKGIVDVYFSRIIKSDKTQELYSGLAGQERSFFQNVIFLSNYGNYSLLYHTDIILLIFAVVGLFFMWKRENRESFFFIIIFLLIPFFFQSAGSPLPKHFVFMPLLLALPAGYSLSYLLEKFKGRYMQLGIIALLTGLMVINLGIAYGTPPSYLRASGTSELKSYINDNVRANDLIVFDSRIYNARSFWLATDHNFITSNSFAEFYNYGKNLNTSKDIIDVYFVECVIDDCGWGWVSTNKEFNASAESLFDSVKNVSMPAKKIMSYFYKGNEIIGEKEMIEEFAVYLVKIPFDSRLVAQTKQINSFYFVPYMYLNMDNYLFNYDAYGLGALSEKLSLWIIYSSMVLTILLLIIAVFFL